MGFESFRVELRGDNKTVDATRNALCRLDHITIDPHNLTPAYSSCFLFRDGTHVIELEVSGDSAPRVSCRFTLAHPPSVDAAFLALVKRLMDLLDMEATVCDRVPPELNHPFGIAAFDEFAAVVSRCISQRRGEWIRAFGTEQLAGTESDVHERIIRHHYTTHEPVAT